MATTPVPASTQTELQKIESKVGVFLTAHHLVIYALLIVSLLGCVYLYQSKRAELAQLTASQAQQALVAEKQHSAELVQQLTAAQVERDQQNQQLQQANQKQQAQTKIQIVHDIALPAPALAQRVDVLTGSKPGSTTSDQNNNIVAPLPVAQQLVSDLDEGALNAQIVVNQNTIIQNLTQDVADKQTIIENDAVILQAQIKTDTDVLKAEKAKERKSKLKWFGIGVAVGFIGREIIKP